MKNFLRILFSLSLVFLSAASTARGAETAADNLFLYPQYSKVISMDFNEAALNDVLKIFSQQSGLNFIASDEIRDKKVTLFLDRVPVESALEQILSANNLTYETPPGSNIFIVKPAVKETDQMETRIYRLKNATLLASKLTSTANIEGSVAADVAMGIISAIKAIISTSGTVIEDPRTNSLIITDVSGHFPKIEQAIAALDISIPQVLIDVEMLDISKEGSLQFGIKFGATPLTFKGGTRNHYYPWNQNWLLDGGKVTEPAYSVGTIDASGLSAALQLLKSRSDTKNLARPRILTLNNETAEIKISTEEAIGIATNTSSSQSTALQSVSAERVKTGVFLTVTPQANLLTNEITMAIVPKVIQARTGGTFSGQTFKDPEERGSKSILRVENNDTIVLGGLLRTDYSNTITKLPVLGDLPVVGTAFQHKDRKDTERELIIFITPHIVTEKPTALALSPSSRITREQDVHSARARKIDETLLTFDKAQK